MKVRHSVLYVATALWDLTVCWPVVLCVRVLWGEKLRVERSPHPARKDGPSLWCDLKAGSWPMRTWYAEWGGTTLGHGGFYRNGTFTQGWSQIQEHEHVHVEQLEAASLYGLFVAIAVFVVLMALGHFTVGPIFGVLLWWLSILLSTGAAMATAWLRGEDPYRGSHTEEAAYSLDDHWNEET